MPPKKSKLVPLEVLFETFQCVLRLLPRLYLLRTAVACTGAALEVSNPY